MKRCTEQCALQLHCTSLIIYKLFIRPHLDYGDIVYNQPNSSLSEKFESMQYNAALAITNTIKGSSKKNCNKS